MFDALLLLALSGLLCLATALVVEGSAVEGSLASAGNLITKLRKLLVLFMDALLLSIECFEPAAASSRFWRCAS